MSIHNSTLLEKQAALYKQALEDIVNPIAALERKLGDDAVLAGAVAVQLSRDPDHLKQIAEQSLLAAQALLTDHTRARKIIFLDIDGVLNTPAAWIGYGERRYFDPTAVALLRRLIEETGAKVVVSSVWRKGSDYLRMSDLLAIGGVGSGVLFYQTPAEGQKHWEVSQQAWRTDPGHDNPRGDKIKEWIETYGSDVTHYVIIDDDRDMLPEQMEHFVHVDGHAGFSFRDFERARKVLGCEVDDYLLRPFRGVGVGYDSHDGHEAGPPSKATTPAVDTKINETETAERNKGEVCPNT